MKPALTIAQQIALLRERGMVVTDGTRAHQFLLDVSYYRFSGYARAFQKDPGRGLNYFDAGRTFESITRIYDFDAQLRGLVGDALDLIEITIRARIASSLAMTLGPAGYRDEINFKNVVLFEQTLAGIEREIGWSKEPFIKHHRDSRPDEPIPVWVVAEALSFGTLSKLFANLGDARIHDAVAKSFGLREPVIRGVIQHLSYLRNICAHRGRLWNRDISTRLPVIRFPATLGQAMAGSDERGTYRSLLVVDYLVRQIDPTNPFPERLAALTAGHTDLLSNLRPVPGWNGSFS